MRPTLASRDAIALLDAEIERKRTGKTLADQAAEYRRSFYSFAKAAWPLVIPGRYIDSWHIRTLCEHYQALVEREILRLLVTIQPRVAKSSIFSVLGPAWAWARNPTEKILSASHADDLATRDTRRSRMLLQTEWFRALLPHFSEPWEFAGDENLKTRYSNTVGGHRIRTHVGGGTGDGGTMLILDDPHNAREAQSAAMLDRAWEWWGDTWLSRLDDTAAERGVMAVVGQRIGEGDLIGRLLDADPSGGRWAHLCLPTRFSDKHRYRYPARRQLRSGKKIQGDVRKKEGQLLAPAYQTEEILEDRTSGMARSVYLAQYEQTPAPKEGFLLKRALWRYYDAGISFYGSERFDAARLPVFRMIVESWDTSVKDRATSDFVSGQVWGIPRDRPADRWLLRLMHDRLGLNATIEAMLDLHAWVETNFDSVRTYVVIENTANGPDAIREIRGRVQGVVVWEAKGNKYQRAEAASPALDGRNLVLPGYATAEGDTYDPATPTDVQVFVEELALFKGEPGETDDQVDAWSQMINFSRRKAHSKGRVSAPRGDVPLPAGLPG